MISYLPALSFMNEQSKNEASDATRMLVHEAATIDPEVAKWQTADARLQVSAEDAPPEDISAEDTHWISLRFQLSKDALRFRMFVLWMWALVSAYAMASCTMFLSSRYPVHGRHGNSTSLRRVSSVDAFVMTSHILVIDISSAIFVLTGFFAAYTVANIAARDRAELCRTVVLYTVIDVWLCAGLALLFGSIFHLSQHSFKPQDLLLTGIEGITCVRVLELRQDSESWHSLNPSSWPVLCLVYCWMLTEFTMSNNERLRRCHPSAAVLPWLNTLLPITIITFFALVHDNSNIFFLNASNLGYRMLEFNLGICFYAALQNHPLTFWKFAAVGNALCPFVLAAFVCTWWAQLGADITGKEIDESCIRMYYFSPCIRMHHGFLMRGCFLGITVMCSILCFSEDSMTRICNVVSINAHSLSACVSAILLTWPMCYMVHLLLQANFGQDLVGDNAALMVLAIPVITFQGALLWNDTCKPYVFEHTEMCIKRVFSFRT